MNKKLITTLALCATLGSFTGTLATNTTSNTVLATKKYKKVTYKPLKNSKVIAVKVTEDTPCYRYEGRKVRKLWLHKGKMIKIVPATHNAWILKGSLYYAKGMRFVVKRHNGWFATKEELQQRFRKLNQERKNLSLEDLVSTNKVNAMENNVNSFRNSINNWVRNGN